MSAQLYSAFLRALLLTVVIEGVAISVLFRCGKYVYYSVLCNLLTNPAMNLLLAISLSIFGEGAYYLTLVVVELAVIFVEAAVYNYICAFGMKKATLLSILLNALSFAVGILVYMIQ